MDKLDKLYRCRDDDVSALRKANLETRVARTPSDDELVKRGLAAQLRHGPPGVGDPGRRVEIGEVETTSVGRVRAVHDQGADEAIIHGVHASLSEIAPDL